MSYPIFALWSHPRSMSTAFERIMRARGDLTCLHEPFMYDYYVNRSTKKMPHFNAVDGHPKSYDDIRDMILLKAEEGPVFFKDMSYYVVPTMLEDTTFLDRITHSYLIRNPKAAILSYARLDPDIRLDEVGLEAQWRHLHAVMERTGRPPVVMQSEAIQTDPAGELHKYWAALGLADRPEALLWGQPLPPPSGSRFQGWHGDVIASNTIKPLPPGQSAQTDADFARLAEAEIRFDGYLKHHMPFYAKLLQLAL